MAIAEVFLGAFLQVLFDRLASPQLWDFARREGIDSRLRKLKELLEVIQGVLGDAETKQIRSSVVNNWLENLRDLAYDAEDLLDEFATEARRRQLMNEPEEASTSRSSKSRTLMKAASCISCFNPCINQHFNIVTGLKIDKIYDRLQEISKQKDSLGLLTTTPDSHIFRAQETTTPTTAYVFHTEVFGRDDDKRNIIAQLQSDDSKLDVIPIVVMGGVGKTTLARSIFHDQSVESFFDLRAWVCVSDDSSVERITKSILQSLDSHVPDPSSLNQLQSKLVEKLRGQKFLLVLDDVWNRGYGDWNNLRSPFGVGKLGSKILVTTRDQRVASVMGNIASHPLKGLSSDDCWSVFIQHAFDDNHRTTIAHESFRQKIVDKCKGLPLVAKSLAGLLRNKPLGREWDDVLDSEIWDLPEDESDILPALRLSYIHLPMHLKSCFSFCAVIPKDYLFEEREVVLLWMAEGLIPDNGKEQMEDLGHKYFQELLSRSFFQSFDGDRPLLLFHDWPLFIMHDLINDLAEFAAGKTCFKLAGNNIESTRFQKVRHLSFSRRGRNDKQNFEVLENAKLLRSFLPFGSYDGEPLSYSLTQYVPLKLLPQLQCIRVLNLGCNRVRELPGEIGDLIHLRYLNLSRSYIRRLPDSASTLCNLQTLILQGCKKLTTLPAGLEKLRNVRHIDCSNCELLQDMPGGIQKLIELRTLSNFIVGKGRDRGIGRLSSLKHLMGRMTISKLENVVDIGDATEAGLINKRRLEGLELCWGGRGDVQNPDFELEILRKLKPYRSLEFLRIDGYGGHKFAEWIGDAAFSRMSFIKLRNCEKCTQLPPLGQLPSLKELWIENLSGVERIGEEFYGGESVFSTAFRSLRWLYIGSCPSLVGELPAVSSLDSVDINRCGKLLASLKLPSLESLRICKSGDGVVGKKMELIVDMEEDEEVDGVVGKKTEINMRLGGVDMEEEEVVECFNKTDDAATRKLLSLVTVMSIRNGDVGEIVGALVRSDMTRAREILHSATSLTIKGLPKLKYLPAGPYLQGLAKLRELTIEDSEELRWVWRMEEMQQQPSAFLHSLRELHVFLCGQLIGLVEEEDEEEEDPVRHGLPHGLEVLRIDGCPKVEKLPRGLQNLTSLRELHLRGCEGLSCLIPDTTAQFPSALMGVALPASLETLLIEKCEKLESLETLTYPPASSLKHLQITNCRNLKSLPEGLQHLTSLSSLFICNCQNMGGLPSSIGRLLSCLTSLVVVDWPAGAVSIQRLGKSNSLPTTLQSISISLITSEEEEEDDDIIGRWDFRSLPSLRELNIYGYAIPNAKTFPHDDDDKCSGRNALLLPPSLMKLRFENFPNLEKLCSSEAFQNLPSLRTLQIWDCPKLRSIPADQLLPSSLAYLSIDGCPLLKQQFAKGKGRYWPTVAFLPAVNIDGRSVFDPEEE